MNARRTIRALAALALLLAASAPAAAQTIGRLFTSVEQRASLDELRYQAQFERPEPGHEPDRRVVDATVAASEESGPTIERLTVNGVVRGRTGPGAVWINGDLIERGGVTREGLQVDVAGNRPQVTVRLPSGADSVALKPGQQIEVRSGTVREPYERVPRDDGPSAFPARPGQPDPAAPATPTETEPPAPGPSRSEALEAAARAGVVPLPSGSR